MTTAADGTEVSSGRSGVESDLGWAIGRVFRAHVKVLNAAFDRFPGGPRGFHVLTVATGSVPRSQLELAHHLGIDRTVMTYLLDDLEDAGLVQRRPDPADRRARHVIATSEGRALQQRLERHLTAAEDHLLGPLDQAERSTLRTLLHRVAERAQDLDPAGDSCDVVEDIRRELSGRSRGTSGRSRRR